MWCFLLCQAELESTSFLYEPSQSIGEWMFDTVGSVKHVGPRRLRRLTFLIPPKKRNAHLHGQTLGWLVPLGQERSRRAAGVRRQSAGLTR